MSDARFTDRVERVQQVLERRQLLDELLHHLAKGFENGVVVDARQVEAVGCQQCQRDDRAVLGTVT